MTARREAELTHCDPGTFKQVVAAVLQQTVDVERDEELSPERVTVQVRGESEGNLQHRDQQEAAGGRLPVPALDLMGDDGDKIVAVHPPSASLSVC